MERICTMLQTHDIHLHVTRSALDELDKLPKDNEVFVQARQFGLDECEIIENADIGDIKQSDNAQHDEGSIESSPSQDIINLVKEGNKNSFFIASQDKQLTDRLRGMVYVPLLWLTKNGVLIFDTPSDASKNVSKRDERIKQKTGGGTMTTEEANLIKRLRQEKLEKKRKEDTSLLLGQGANMRKRKKAKEPNPLSCKKKKIDQNQTNAASAKKRRRRKKTNDVSED